MRKNLRYCFPLSHARPPDVIGGKAGSLHELYQKKVSIPRSLVISSDAFEEFSKGIQPEIHGQFHIPDQSIGAVDKQCKKLWETLLEKGIGNRIFDNIYQTIEKTFGKTELIFRSSAIGEDSKENSFAGQLDSVITDSKKPFKTACHDALLQCWASYWNLRSISYQSNRQTLLGGLAVVVQPYIHSELSGVLFTQAPAMTVDRGSGHPFLLECVRGAGEALVSGRADPEQFLFYNKPSGIEIRAIHGGGDGCAFLNPYKTSIKKLIDMAGGIVKDAGVHQDIEWTIDTAKRLWILQVRPLTVKAMEDDEIHIWSNVNVNENFPEVLTPFLMSFAVEGYYHYFKNLSVLLGIRRQIRRRLEPAFETIIGFHHGTMFYNLTNIYKCLSAFPLPDLANRYWDCFIGIYDLPYDRLPNKLLPENRLVRTLYMLKVAVLSFKHILLTPLYVKRFERRVDRHVKKCNSGKMPHTLQRYKTDIRNFIHIRMYGWKEASLADALAMFGYGFLRSSVNTYAPPLSAHIHHLLVGISNLVSHESQQRLWELSEIMRKSRLLSGLFEDIDSKEIFTRLNKGEDHVNFFKKFSEYQKKWGYRISGELLLTRPDYGEAPEQLIDLLKCYLKESDPSPENKLQIQRIKRIDVTRQILEYVGKNHAWPMGMLRKSLIRISIFLAHKGIRSRERVRLKQAKLYNQCRHSLLSLGEILKTDGLIGTSEDILFLKHNEICALSTSHAPALIMKIILERKKRHKDDQKLSLPESFQMPAGKLFSAERQTPPDIDTFLEKSKCILSGHSACGGRVIGKVRILQDISSIAMLEKGDILVTRQTDPGWAPAFPLISGLILERGGMLSHGAIIAREYGIPALVGVKGATSLLVDGERVLLDVDRCSVFREGAICH